MVLGILTAVAACPAVSGDLDQSPQWQGDIDTDVPWRQIIGTTEAVRHGERQNAREQHRSRKCNLSVTLYKSSEYNSTFNGARIVLRDKKLYVDVRKVSDLNDSLHFFTGYFLPYPGEMAQTWRAKGFRKGEGMVTTISDDPPYLNWVYVDSSTYEVKYGVRSESDKHLPKVGPWDCTKFDRRLTFDGWEGFIAVEEEEGSGLWALYFDCDDDGLRGKDRIGSKGKRMLELEIWRKELRWDRTSAIEERVERIQARREQDEKRVG